MYPKQLLPLTGEETMLQQTAQRLKGMQGTADACLVVCNEAHRFLVAEQMRHIGQSARVVLEPEGRNTAPAVALAAFLVAEQDPESMLLVMPADHVIADKPAFQAAVSRGRKAAMDDKLVTFGIVPTHPETGYGYVRARPSGASAVPVEAFVEKPDRETAQAYVDSGEYFWNSGIFLFKARAYLDALAEFAPAIHEACRRSIDSRVDTDFVRPDADAFVNSPSDSIDYAVMEKTAAAAMVPLDAGWSDVGSWSALHDVRKQDADGNTIDGDVVTHDCKGTIVQAESRLVTAVGLEDMIVIETKDSMLVASKSKSQDVKHLVDKLKAADRSETRLHRQVFRPWGSYDSLENIIGCEMESADRILPEYQDVKVGDRVLFMPEKKGHAGQVVAAVDPGRSLLLYGLNPKTGEADESATWLFYLEELEGDRTHLITRQRLSYEGFGPSITWHIVEPLHFVMERKMLLGIKARAEAGAGTI